MAASTHTITALETSAQALALIPSLRTLLQDNVNRDPASSSIGFRAPLSDADADAFWAATARKLDEEPRTVRWFVLMTTIAAGQEQKEKREEVLATVQISSIPKPTHRHRAEIVKLLVRPSAQGQGLGRRIMAHAEDFARGVLGFEVLTLDTATETPARGFYNRLEGWREWGTCPEYADFADGTRGDATFFVKILRDG